MYASGLPAFLFVLAAAEPASLVMLSGVPLSAPEPRRLCTFACMYTAATVCACPGESARSRAGLCAAVCLPPGEMPGALLTVCVRPGETA